MNTEKTRDLILHLETFISENKREKIDRVLAHRTQHVTIVLEDLFQEHNASAVVRSAEIMGIQDVYAVETRNTFSLNKNIAMGSAQWIDVHRRNNVITCIQELKANGYRIIATTPHHRSQTLSALSLDHPLALIFGTELHGISSHVIDHADEFVTIPMFGFTESYNVSVSVALCLYEVMMRLHSSSISWHLRDDACAAIKLRWLRAMLPYAQELERLFNERES